MTAPGSSSFCRHYIFNFSAFYLTMSCCFVLSRGQAHPSGGSKPYFGPSLKLDFELEMVSLLFTHIFCGYLLTKKHI